MSKRKGDFRSKIDSILAEGDGGAAPASLATPTDETRTDSIEIGKIFLPAGRRPDQDVSELLSSVKRRGVLQPLLLRPVGSRYEVVDGARRLVAARQTGRTAVPAVVRKLSAAEARATASKDRPIVAPSRTAGRTVTASKAKAVRKATGKAPAKAPLRAVTALAKPAAAVAAPKAAAAAPEAPAPKAMPAAKSPAAAGQRGSRRAGARTGVARRAPKRQAGRRLARPTAGVQIFGEAAPPPLPPIEVETRPPAIETRNEAETGLVGAAPAAEAGASTPPSAPAHQQKESVAGGAPSSAANSVLSLPRRRSGRARAMAGWYIFLAVLFVASFSLTNLAINHEPSLSLATGGVAGVGVVVVVIILATGQ